MITVNVSIQAGTADRTRAGR